MKHNDKVEGLLDENMDDDHYIKEWLTLNIDGNDLYLRHNIYV